MTMLTEKHRADRRRAIQALIAHGCDIDIRDHEGLFLSPALLSAPPPLCVCLCVAI